MLDFLSQGFLGNRADFLSDLLLIALMIIVPLLGVAWTAARRRRLGLHQALMWTVLGVVVGYVVVYEAAMMAQGGTEFLRGRIRMDPVAYFSFLAAHVVMACAALIVSVVALVRGRRALAGNAPGATHRRTGYWALALLVVAVASGGGVYYLTFVYEAA